MKFFAFIVLTLLLNSTHTFATELLSTKDFLKSELSQSEKMAKESFNLTADQKKELAALAPDAQDTAFTFYYGKTGAGALEKSCTIVMQKGKEGPLQLGFCFSITGEINSVKILSTEEERGRKIEEESFLKQFRGKKVSDAYEVGKDIDGVSGATWSSKAVAEAARKSSYAFKTFVEGKIEGNIGGNK